MSSCKNKQLKNIFTPVSFPLTSSVVNTKLRLEQDILGKDRQTAQTKEKEKERERLVKILGQVDTGKGE